MIHCQSLLAKKCPFYSSATEYSVIFTAADLAWRSSVTAAVRTRRSSMWKFIAWGSSWLPYLCAQQLSSLLFSPLPINRLTDQ